MSETRRTPPMLLMIGGGAFLVAGVLCVLLAFRGQDSLWAMGAGFLAVTCPRLRALVAGHGHSSGVVGVGVRVEKLLNTCRSARSDIC